MEPLTNVIWSTWEASQAIAFLRVPETQPHKQTKKSDLAKQLINLANTASIRSKGTWCNMQQATASEKEWAKSYWPFDVQQQVEGANGIIEACTGAMSAP